MEQQTQCSQETRIEIGNAADFVTYSLALALTIGELYSGYQCGNHYHLTAINGVPIYQAT